MEVTNAIDDIIARYAVQISDYRSDFIRLCFILSEAYWLYSDFYAALTKINLTEKEFYKKVFTKCTVLSEHIDRFDQNYSDYMTYKSKIPVYGAIILDPTLTNVLTITDYHNTHYDFPKGKRNQDEKDLESAIREVYEEIGYDISPKLKEDEYIMIETFKDKFVKLFVITGVQKETVFKSQTRCEIGTIEWREINNLLMSCYSEQGIYRSIRRFIYTIKKWIENKKNGLLGYTSGDVKFEIANELDDEASMSQFEQKDDQFWKKAIYYHYTLKKYEPAKKYYEKCILISSHAKEAIKCIVQQQLLHKQNIIEIYKYIDERKVVFCLEPHSTERLLEKADRCYKYSEIPNEMKNKMRIIVKINSFNQHHTPIQEIWESDEAFIRRILDYDPSVKSIHALYEKPYSKSVGATLLHYLYTTQPEFLAYNPDTTPKKIYVVECYSEVDTVHLCEMCKKARHSYSVLSPDQILIDNYTYFDNKSTFRHFSYPLPIFINFQEKFQQVENSIANIKKTIQCRPTTEDYTKYVSIHKNFEIDCFDKLRNFRFKQVAAVKNA